MSDASSPLAINHHADHPGFAGPLGVLGGLAFMLVGRAKAELAVEIADVSAGDHVVDVGCGPGTAARRAAHQGARVTAVDPSSALLGLARAVSRQRAGITWREGTAENLPVAERSATVVWALATVHHWRDVDKAVAEAYRVLGAGGRLIAVERRSPPGATGLASHGWTEQQAESFAALCRGANFDDVAVTKHRTHRQAVWVVTGTRR